jgi:hypothetical protein
MLVLVGVVPMMADTVAGWQQGAQQLHVVGNASGGGGAQVGAGQVGQVVTAAVNNDDVRRSQGGRTHRHLVGDGERHSGTGSRCVGQVVDPSATHRITGACGVGHKGGAVEVKERTQLGCTEVGRDDFRENEERVGRVGTLDRETRLSVPSTPVMGSEAISSGISGEA